MEGLHRSVRFEEAVAVGTQPGACENLGQRHLHKASFIKGRGGMDGTEYWGAGHRNSFVSAYDEVKGSGPDLIPLSRPQVRASYAASSGRALKLASFPAESRARISQSHYKTNVRRTTMHEVLWMASIPIHIYTPKIKTHCTVKTMGWGVKMKDDNMLKGKKKGKTKQSPQQPVNKQTVAVQPAGIDMNSKQQPYPGNQAQALFRNITQPLSSQMLFLYPGAVKGANYVTIILYSLYAQTAQTDATEASPYLLAGTLRNSRICPQVSITSNAWGCAAAYLR